MVLRSSHVTGVRVSKLMAWGGGGRGYDNGEGKVDSAEWLFLVEKGGDFSMMQSVEHQVKYSAGMLHC